MRRHRNVLARAGTSKLPDDMADYKLERPLLYSALIMRRLIESRKVTDRVKAASYQLEAFPTLPDRQEVLSRILMQSDIDREFDFSAGQGVTMDCWNISSEILHSGFLNWEVDDDGKVVAFLIASIRNHKLRLLRLPLGTYLSALDNVQTDYVSKFEVRVTGPGKTESKLS